MVGGLEHDFVFHIIGNVIIPTDFHSIIFQRGREKPPSSKSMSGENPWISNGQIQQLSSVILLIFP